MQEVFGYGFESFRNWVGRDLQKFQALMLVKIRKQQKVVDGMFLKVMGKRIQLRRVIGHGITLMTSTGVGAFIGILAGGG